jgi:hypothetical protein
VAEPEAEVVVDDHVHRRVMRLLHAPSVALLLGIGLAPLFILFPRLPGGSAFDPSHDPTLKPVALWLGTALIGGLAGALDGAARPLYLAAALILGASLLSIPAMRLALLSGLPFPHGLATWLGLDGEYAMEADLYEIWLVAWLACLGLIVLVRYRFVQVLRQRQARAAGGAITAPTGPRSRRRARGR